MIIFFIECEDGINTSAPYINGCILKFANFHLHDWMSSKLELVVVVGGEVKMTANTYVDCVFP